MDKLEDRHFGLNSNWIRTGALLGFLCLVCYFFQLTDRSAYLAEWTSFLYGPFLALFTLTFYHYLRGERTSPLLQSWAVLNILAGFAACLWQVLQSITDRQLSLLSTENAVKPEEYSRLLLESGGGLLPAVELVGDIFIFSAAVFLALALIDFKSNLYKFFGSLCLLIGAGGLLMNMIAWPLSDPTRAGLIDFYPFLMAWYAFPVSVMLFDTAIVRKQNTMPSNSNGKMRQMTHEGEEVISGTGRNGN